MTPTFNDMADVATAFCNLIENVEVADSSWLQEMSALLPRLHAAVAALGTDNVRNELYMTPDLDARFELFAQLRELLGSRDGYWMEFDTTHDEHNKSGSLADDLTDIYCELKHGLRLIDEEPGLAFEGWRNGYRMHWGKHLLDAERHLYELKSRNQL
ncbi:MAG: DUF5063 domain-containing protein [Gammaproteobacteria bacterium]|nr:DUF5063 domain-containing protein [Gammaproteobacteria bacterium]